MKSKKSVWIPAILAMAAAIGCLVYFFLFAKEGGPSEGMRPKPGMVPPAGFKREESGDIFKTLGTVSVFLGAAAFCWFWFKRRLKSPSKVVRIAGRLLHRLHNWIGYAALVLVGVHGIYFLVKKFRDHNTWSGLAAFAILLGLAGYGFFINKIRNKYMRLVHRVLAISWVPLLWIHAGGSAIMATAATLAVWGLVHVLHRTASRGQQNPHGNAA